MTGLERLPEPLETDRLRLRRPVPSDAEAMFRAFSTGQMPASSNWSQVRAIEDVETHLARQIARWTTDEGFSFAITHANDDRFLGQVSFIREPEPDTWLLGYWIAPTDWGRGYATEAAGAVVDVAFARLGAQSIWAGTVHENIASQRVLGKLGFVYRQENPSGYSVGDRVFATREYERVAAR